MPGAADALPPGGGHGKPVILAMLAYAGRPQAGERASGAVPRARRAARRHGQADALPGDVPAEEGDGDYHPLAVATTMLIDRVDRDAADTIVELLEASDAPMRVAQLRVLGGAMARVADDATAFAHRQSRIMVNLAAFYEGPEDRPRRQAWLDDFAAALDQGDRRRT